MTRSDEIKSRIKELNDEIEALNEELWEHAKQDSGYYIGWYEHMDNDYATLEAGYKWLGHITEYEAKKWADNFSQGSYDTAEYFKVATEYNDPNVDIGYSLAKSWDLWATLKTNLKDGFYSELSAYTATITAELLDALETDMKNLHKELNLGAFGACDPDGM